MNYNFIKIYNDKNVGFYYLNLINIILKARFHIKNTKK